MFWLVGYPQGPHPLVCWIGPQHKARDGFLRNLSHRARFSEEFQRGQIRSRRRIGHKSRSRGPYGQMSRRTSPSGRRALPHFRRPIGLLSHVDSRMRQICCYIVPKRLQLPPRRLVKTTGLRRLGSGTRLRLFYIDHQGVRLLRRPRYRYRSIKTIGRR